jgi:pyrroloquinoline-quinone synthase
MDRIAQLNALVEQFDLNKHPFYQDWRMGTLPMEKLRDYAAEYGRFVGTIAEGWETIGEQHYADEERVHERLWAQFQLSVGAGSGSKGAQTDALVTAAKVSFAVKPEAVGALYAFEAQQPHTSQSKLDGLKEHYPVDEAGREYFVVHAGDTAEQELLEKVVAGLSDEEFARAKSACALTCAAMWSALDGVYYTA